MWRYAILLTFGACLYEDKTFTPLACSDDPPETTDKQSAIMGGIVVDARLGTPLQGVTLNLLNGTLTQVDGPIQSSTTGNFGLTLPLGGAPFERAYVKAELADYVTSFASNSTPVIDDVTFMPLGLVSRINAAGVAMGTLGAPSFTPGTGTVFATLRDCSGAPLENATVTTDSPGARVFYFAGVDPSNVPKATTGRGIAMISDLTGPTVDITVHLGSDSIPARTYRVEPDAFTQFDIIP